MKTRFILTVALALIAYCASAQKSEMTKTVTKDEVPVAVIQSLQKDYANLGEKGTWKLFFFEDLKTSKCTPELYEYSCKKDGEKVYLYFKPDGTVDHAKGITVQTPTHTSQP
jgi:hypothetical protein